MRHLTACLLLLVATSCDGTDPLRPDASGDEDSGLLNGCPTHPDPLASPGDPIDGDTWDTFAMDFFATWCTGCHSSTLTGDDRAGAPEGFNWDDEGSVRDNLSAIRSAVGVTNFMPPDDPRPPCDERERLVRWIDAGAP